jgi:hypothetical protein
MVEAICGSAWLERMAVSSVNVPVIIFCAVGTSDVVLMFVRGWVDLRAVVRLEGLGKLGKKNFTSFGTWTGDLPDCSIVPQPTTLPRVLQLCMKYLKVCWIWRRDELNKEGRISMSFMEIVYKNMRWLENGIHWRNSWKRRWCFEAVQPACCYENAM